MLRFRQRKSDSLNRSWQQKALRLFIVINIVALGSVTFYISHSTNDQVVSLVSQQRPTRVFALAENNSLIYAVRLEQWSFGVTTRAAVESSRADLSQTLNTPNVNGQSPAMFANTSYLKALKDTGSILQSTVPGVLPAELQKSVQLRLKPITEQIIVQSRALYLTYEQYLNISYTAQGRNQNIQEHATLIVLFLLLGLFIFLESLYGRLRQSNFRRKEEIIQNESEELNRLIEQLSLSQAAVESLEELSKTKTAFVTNMNHELRTPLGSIIGYVEIVQEMTENKPELGIRNYLEVIDKNASLLLDLVDDIFSLTKLDSNLAPLADVSVDISQIVEESITILQPDREKKKIEIHRAIDPKLSFFVQGDKGRLVQVVVNLLSNAIKFSKPNSQIDVGVHVIRHEDNLESIQIIVRDYGIGIPASEVSKLFTRFYRAKNAKDRQYPGTGLGLSIVEQIVHAHGGTVRVESVEGEGTTFIVELPKNLSAAEELVLNRREAVLRRAIKELEEAPKQELSKVSHSLSGLIGFYTFEEESRMIRDFSNWLTLGNVIDPVELEHRRKAIMTELKNKLDTLPPKEDR